jgi:hypothetical protein
LSNSNKSKNRAKTGIDLFYDHEQQKEQSPFFFRSRYDQGNDRYHLHLWLPVMKPGIAVEISARLRQLGDPEKAIEKLCKKPVCHEAEKRSALERNINLAEPLRNTATRRRTLISVEQLTKLIALDEELDFIINYDIKYRMGKGAGEVDGDE